MYFKNKSEAEQTAILGELKEEYGQSKQSIREYIARELTAKGIELQDNLVDAVFDIIEESMLSIATGLAQKSMFSIGVDYDRPDGPGRSD